MANQDKVRLTVDLPVNDALLIDYIAVANKTNRVTALVKALRTLHLIDSAVSKGAHVEIIDTDGRVQVLTFQ